MHYSTKIIELGSCAFRQPTAKSHCRFVHGYRLTAKFWFAANELDENNWVVDFGGLKELKKLLQKQFDHTTCVSRTDPKLDEFKRLEQAGVCDLRIMDDGVGIEKFAEWCHSAADNFVGVITKLRCRCVRVEVFEHENNSAIYESYPEQEPQHTAEKGYSTIEGMVRQSTNNPLPDTSRDHTSPSNDEKVEDIANDKSQKEDTAQINNLTGQRKTQGQWVDPKYKGNTKNTWLF